jgi:hypothetical protein
MPGLMSFEDLLVLMRMEYEEMPDLKLTLLQARRLWDVPLDVCDAALGALVDRGFLERTRDGAFMRAGRGPAFNAFAGAF